MRSRALLERAPGLVPPVPLALFEAEPAVRPLEIAGATPGRVWVWDDAAIGGNKIRKLEWLLADSLAAGRRGVIVYGPTGSNWVWAAVREARRAGLAARAVFFPRPAPPYAVRNLERTRAAADEVVELSTVGRVPLACLRLLARHPDHEVYAPGGSSIRGSLGYVEAALVLADRVAAGEFPEPSCLFVAAGSGGTAAGLAAGLELTPLRTRVAAVRVTDLALMNRPILRAMAHRILVHLERAGGRRIPRRLAPGRLLLGHRWFGPGYAVATEAALQATERAGACGIALETTYTGKTLAAVLDRCARLRGPVLFWNTYGG